MNYAEWFFRVHTDKWYTTTTNMNLFPKTFPVVSRLLFWNFSLVCGPFPYAITERIPAQRTTIPQHTNIHVTSGRANTLCGCLVGEATISRTDTAKLLPKGMGGLV